MSPVLLAKNTGIPEHKLNEIKKIVEKYADNFKDAPIRSVLNVQMSGPAAIEWPDLDVDLEIDSLRHPERYPLVIKRSQVDFVAE